MSLFCIKTQKMQLSTTVLEEERYASVKRSLQLDETGINSGIYNGTWHYGNAGRSMNKQLNPSTRQVIGRVIFGNTEDYTNTIKGMDAVKKKWANTPSPLRGEVVRQIGEKLRFHKEDLGYLISLEMGKIYTEGLGEVQEAIDICDYAVGLSRCLNGSVIPSERPGHVMMERYNPLKGHVGIITAFNFPVAVYFWNLALSLVCGNTNLWKPNESLSLTSVAVTKLVADVLEKNGHSGAIASMICGTGNSIGELMVKDRKMELISFTGSTAVGRYVSQQVLLRFGKQILELGGNNAMIVDRSADVSMAVRSTLFGAVGTAGQRCTTQRRLYLHEEIYDSFLQQLLKAYKSVKIGSPFDPATLCGPLHNDKAVETFRRTVQQAVAEGGSILQGGKVLDDLPGFFVEPTVIAMDNAIGNDSVVMVENFVPILYVLKVSSVEEAVELNNSVSHGLSSSLFTKDLGQIFRWSGPDGSDCGIVNVNIGTSGAEIGGAFGGEKDTGGGRESGSDCWKQYMRRSTCTVNYSDALPLAQGVTFL